MDVWYHVGMMLLSVVSGVATAGFVALIGGMGVMTALRRRIENVEISMENVDRRLTTEVKARGSAKGVEARAVAKTLEEDARGRLNLESAPTRPGRPTPLILYRR